MTKNWQIVWLINFTKQNPFPEANILQLLNKSTLRCGSVIQFHDEFNTSYGETRNIKFRWDDKDTVIDKRLQASWTTLTWSNGKKQNYVPGIDFPVWTGLACVRVLVTAASLHLRSFRLFLLSFHENIYGKAPF